MSLLRTVVFLTIAISLVLLAVGLIMFERWTLVQMSAPGVMALFGGFNLVWGVAFLVFQGKIARLERSLAAQREDERSHGHFAGSIR